MTKYRLRLLIKHPNIDPREITTSLELMPNAFAKAGTVRATPTGTVLPGEHEVSMWSHWVEVSGKRQFFSGFSELMNKLETHKAFLAEIVLGGGSLALIVDLPGRFNIGDTLPWTDMARLCALQINLGVEVFPHWSRDQ